MQIRDMVRADPFTVDLAGTADTVTTITVGRGLLPPGRWRVNLFNPANLIVGRSEYRVVNEGQREMAFPLERPVAWRLARVCTIGFENTSQELST